MTGLLFCAIWIIALVPKTIQLPILLFVLVFLLIKNRFKIVFDFGIIMHLFFFCICIISLLLNAANIKDGERFLAAVNTALSWLVSALFYSFYKNYPKLNIEKIQKYAFVNTIILIGLGLLYVVAIRYSADVPTIAGRTLFRTDWLSSGKTTRLKAYLEYPNLLVPFYMITEPLLVQYLKKFKLILRIVIFVMASIVPIMTNSRIGLVLIGVLVYFQILELVLVTPKLKILKKIIPIIAIVMSVLFVGVIVEGSYTMLSSRASSNSTRANIYTESVKRTMEGHILLGNGAKEMLGEYPLGSHSTYIGTFYRTGAIGLVVFLVFFITQYSELVKNNKKQLLVAVPMLLLAVFFVFEDLDGSNWLTVYFYSVMGILSNSSIRRKKIDKE